MHNCEQKTRDWNLEKKFDNSSRAVDNCCHKVQLKSVPQSVSQAVSPPLTVEPGRGRDLILLRHLKMLEYQQPGQLSDCNTPASALTTLSQTIRENTRV